MHIKTSTMVAAGILALAGTPLALHLAGGASKNGSATSWVKKLHGGGTVAGHGSAGSTGSTGSTGSAAPQSISDLTGKWIATIESAEGRMECAMALKQDGTKITGTFANPHGDGEFAIHGERKDNQLEFSVDGKTDHGDMRVEFTATIKKEDGSIAGTMKSSMGESRFTAKRNKS
jgi:hypothetical protein